MAIAGSRGRVSSRDGRDEKDRGRREIKAFELDKSIQIPGIGIRAQIELKIALKPTSRLRSLLARPLQREVLAIPGLRHYFKVGLNEISSSYAHSQPSCVYKDYHLGVMRAESISHDRFDHREIRW